MIKRFLEWIKLKEKLHDAQKGPPLVKERDLWWISFGENVGSEINGKSGLFSRPGVIIKKLSRGSYLVVPTTLQKKEGTWHVPILCYINDIPRFLCGAAANRRMQFRYSKYGRNVKCG